MNDFMYEQLVARKAKATDHLIRIATIMLIAALIILGFLYFGFLALLLAAVMLFLAIYFIFPRLKVEYEYALLNHEMQIDIIYNKSRRKKLVEFDLQKAEGISRGIPAGQHKAEITYDCTSGTDPQTVYAVTVNVNHKNACILIEPDGTMKSYMNQWLAPHMHLH